jgi:hypothetical protein
MQGAESPHAEEAVVLETGRAFFLYRPKVDAKEVHSAEDVSHFFLLLSPEGALGYVLGAGSCEKQGGASSKQKAGAKHRLLLITSKILPDASTRTQHWGFVTASSENIADISKDLQESTYHTKTRGERTKQAMRLVGEAIYEIVHHKRATSHGNTTEHTHLMYCLQLPHNPCGVQKEFNIEKKGNFLIMCKNPHSGVAVSRAGKPAGLKEKYAATYPLKLQAIFAGIRKDEVKFRPMVPVELMNYPGTQFLLVGSSPDLVGPLGWNDLERKSCEDEHQAFEAYNEHVQNTTYRELQVSPDQVPLAVTSFK